MKDESRGSARIKDVPFESKRERSRRYSAEAEDDGTSYHDSAIIPDATFADCAVTLKRREARERHDVGVSLADSAICA